MKPTSLLYLCALISFFISAVAIAQQDGGVTTIDTKPVEVKAQKTTGQILDQNTDGGIQPDLNLPEPAQPSKQAAEPEEEDLGKPLAPDRMPTIELAVNPTEAKVGEAITWKAIIKRRVGDRIHLASSADFGGLDVQNKQTSTSVAQNDWIDETLEISLISFEPGDFEIPAQKLTVVDIDGNIANIRTEKKSVEIKSLIANEPEPTLKLDTGPGVSVLVEDYTILYVLAGLGAALLVVLLTLLIRKLLSLRKPKSIPPPPPRPAEEIAHEKLEKLKNAPYLVDGEFKLFHIELSELLREYLGNRYKFHSLDRSTEELIGDIQNQNLNDELLTRIITLLEETDIVKFAKYIPSIEASQSMFDETASVIEVTTPSQTPVPTEVQSTTTVQHKEGENA